MITCILVSHNKPQYVNEAIESVLNQEYQDWQCILVDSGILYDQGFFQIKDQRFEVRKSNENSYVKNNKAPAPWCFNECFRKNWVKGELICYLCDDDIFYSNAFGVFVDFKKENPHVEAMYASQDTAIIDLQGNRYPTGERRALEVMGSAGQGRSPDCVLDYLQFCHTLDILKRRKQYWPEKKSTQHHADGVFMAKIGSIVPIYPIDIKIGQNRRTPISTYIPS